LLLGWCFVQLVLAAGWSEYYLPFVALYDSLQQHSAELALVTFVLVAALCFVHNRKLGTLVFVLALVVSSVPYWSAPGIRTGHEVALPAIARFSGPPNRQFMQLIPTVPVPIISSLAIIPAFVVAAALLVLAFEFRRIRRLLSVSLLSLFPPALYLSGVLNGNVALGMSWPLLMFVLLCAGGGLLGTCTHFFSSRPA
jgi:hypothetical protein